MQIYYSSKFEREYKKLPRRIQELAEEKERMFRSDPFNNALETHKLHGRLKGFWAFWIDHQYRVIFEFRKENIVWFHSVGDHSIYQK